jgi:hypothetical protein
MTQALYAHMNNKIIIKKEDKMTELLDWFEHPLAWVAF